MKIAYRKVRLSKQNKQRLSLVNSIIEEYKAIDLVLTLRQLYYQLVSKDIIPNSDKEYKKLGNLIKEGRMGGIVDWNAIEDRLRVPKSAPGWESPKEILKAASNQFRLNRDEDQPQIEVWVEKDALSSIVNRAVNKYNIASMVNRGYSSASAMHDAFMRFNRRLTDMEPVTILYLGDHDPSGLDMVRDIKTRLIEFAIGDNYISRYGLSNYLESTGISEDDFFDEDRNLSEEDLSIVNSFENKVLAMALIKTIRVEPIALTMDQINTYNPPPNPAKLTDVRSRWYVENYGYKSWEVDALKPEVLIELITSKIESYIDMDKFNDVLKKEKEYKNKLNEFIENFD